MTNGTNIWELTECSKRIKRAKYLLVLFVRTRSVRLVCSKRLYVKPATQYLSLFANNDGTTFSRKKLSFARSDEKGVYTLFVIDPSFCKRVVET